MRRGQLQPSDLTALKIDSAGTPNGPVLESSGGTSAAPRAPRWISLLVWLAVLAVGVVLIGMQLTSQELDARERACIGQSYYYWLYWDAEKADWGAAEWTPAAGNRSAEAHSPIAKYLWGFSLKMFGKQIDSQRPVQFADAQEEQDLRLPARLPGAVAGIVACLALLSIGRRVAGLFAGLFAGVLLAINPVMREAACFMTYEVIAAAWVLLAIWIFCVFYRRLADTRPRWGRLVIFALVEGVLVGLAVGTKLTGLMALAVCLAVLGMAFVGIAIAGRGERGGRLMALFVAGLCATIVAAATIYVLDPYVAQNPIRNLSETASYRLDGLKQADKLGRPVATAPAAKADSNDLADRAKTVGLEAMGRHASVYVEDFEHIRKVNFGVFALGALVLVIMFFARLFRRGAITPAIALVFALGVFAMTILWYANLPARHYLPAAIVTCLMQGIALGLVFDLILKARLKRREQDSGGGSLIVE